MASVLGAVKAQTEKLMYIIGPTQMLLSKKRCKSTPTSGKSLSQFANSQLQCVSAPRARLPLDIDQVRSHFGQFAMVFVANGAATFNWARFLIVKRALLAHLIPSIE